MEYKVPLVNLKKQYEAIACEVEEAALRVMASARYIGGEEVSAFEAELSAYLGCPSPSTVISCGNGTDALLIAYMTAGLKPGDEVIIPTHNYVAAAEAALLLGLKIVWADVPSPSSLPEHRVCFQIDSDPRALRPLCSGRTRALVAVNMYGMPSVTPRLRSFCREQGLVLIEDNAQGMGGKTQFSPTCIGPTGTGGDIITTSFFPTKPLGGMGDGGAVIIPEHTEWQAIAREIRQHGQSNRYHYQRVGMNSRLDTLQAAILRIKLRYLPERIQSVGLIAGQYDEELGILPLLRIERPWGRGAVSSYYQYTLWVPPVIRDHLLASLKEQGIESRLYYPTLLHQTAIYGARREEKSAHLSLCPAAEQAHAGMLCLPIDPLQTQEQTEYVIHSFTESYLTLLDLCNKK